MDETSNKQFTALNLHLSKEIENCCPSIAVPRNGFFRQMGIIVDADNFTKNLTKQGIRRIDWNKFLYLFSFWGFRLEGRAWFFETVSDETRETKKPFYTFLAKTGWQIEPIELVSIYDRNRKKVKNKAGSDVAPSVKAMEWLLHERIDLLILITGDRDFIPLVKSYTQHGAKVATISVEGGTSADLLDASSVVFNFSIMKDVLITDLF